MESNKMIKTHASLFSGIGGAEIAASWMGWTNVFHCEIQEFPRRVLEYWYPNSKSYEDITKTDFTEWRGKIDVLTAGFPCQPFSLAGQRRGADDDRYLWPETLRAIREIQPTWFVGENVAGLVTMVQPGEDIALGRTDDIFDENYIYRKEQRFTLDEICEGFEREGYAVQPFVIPACAVGAPHRRDRIWIVANRSDAGSETLQCGGKNGVHSAGLAADTDINRQRKRTNEQEFIAECKSTSDNSYGGENGSVADTVCAGRQKYHAASEPVKTLLADRQGDTERPASHPNGDGHTPRQTRVGTEGSQRPAGYAEGEGLERSERNGVRWKQPRLADAGLPSDRWADFPTQSPVCSGHDGVSLGLAGITFPRWRAEAVKALGNAMVPQVVYEIFRAIEQVENEKQ